METEEIILDEKEFENACREAGLGKSLENFTSRIGDKELPVQWRLTKRI